MMTILNDDQRNEVENLLKAAAEPIANGVPDDVVIEIDAKNRIVFRGRVWTSALKRQDLTFKFGLDTARRNVASISDSMSWEEAAPLIIGDFLGPVVKVQRARWASAEAFGLVRGGDVADLPPREMAVDRLLLEMLDAADFDIGRAAVLARGPFGLQDGDELPLVMAAVRHHDRVVFARHERLGRPVIGTWMRVGRAQYDGTILALDADLPETVMAAAAGRRLGDVVGTGNRRLDERIIVGIHHLGQREFGFNLCDTGLTHEIELEPDNIRLADAKLRCRRGVASR